MARPITGKETKINRSVKVEPAVLKKIEEVYGSFTAFVNLKIKNDKKLK